jgi:hypothetical protein
MTAASNEIAWIGAGKTGSPTSALVAKAANAVTCFPNDGGMMRLGRARHSTRRLPSAFRLSMFHAMSLNSPAVLFADHAAPCRQALGGMLLHPLRELRRAHQAGLH